MKKLHSPFKSLSLLLLCSAATAYGMETNNYSPTKQLPSAQKVDTPFITIELSSVEDDLSNNQWAEVINDIASNLQNLYHPNINAQSIQQFKNNMLTRNEFSIANIKEALKNSFGSGHVCVTRAKTDPRSMAKFISRDSKHTAKYLCLNGSDRQRVAHYYNPSETSKKDLENYLDDRQKITLQVFKSENGNVPIITVPSFEYYNAEIFKNKLAQVTTVLSSNYDYIMLDLRGNNGGDLGLTYHFLSLFLGNNDPDIYPLPVPNNQKLSYENLNNKLKGTTLPPFYQCTLFDSVTLTKNSDITFKKMVVLVDGKTFSSGEIVAATLKNTLGKKVCILGQPCVGSFEQENKTPMNLPHDFKLYLSGENTIFYSKKLATLLTGCRLLPDIRHEDMSTIKEKAVDILYNSVNYNSIDFPEKPSYERTGSQK